MRNHKRRNLLLNIAIWVIVLLISCLFASIVGWQFQGITFIAVYSIVCIVNLRHIGTKYHISKNNTTNYSILLILFTGIMSLVCAIALNGHFTMEEWLFSGAFALYFQLLTLIWCFDNKQRFFHILKPE